MRAAIAIPARFDSTRLPGKPLLDLGGKTLIRRCYECVKSAGLDTYVLTDDQRIVDEIGSDAHMITGPYNNGSERIAAAAEQGLFDNYNTVVNVQGDQPYVDPTWIDKVLTAIKKDSLNSNSIAHMYSDLAEGEENDPSVVKMTIVNGEMQWASRSFTYGKRFVGVYGYSVNFLKWHNKLPVLDGENCENIEQLRWIEHGYKVRVLKTEIPDNFVDINTQNDVDKWRRNNDSR